MNAEGTRYTRTAVVLHWAIAAAVFVQIGLGVWMIGIPKSPPGVRAYWFNVHKSIGITIGLLVIARLLWRLAHRPPALPATMAPWQRMAAKLSHFALYATRRGNRGKRICAAVRARGSPARTIPSLAMTSSFAVSITITL
jgi:cytochrome b561